MGDLRKKEGQNKEQGNVEAGQARSLMCYGISRGGVL